MIGAEDCQSPSRIDASIEDWRRKALAVRGSCFHHRSWNSHWRRSCFGLPCLPFRRSHQGHLFSPRLLPIATDWSFAEEDFDLKLKLPFFEMLLLSFSPSVSPLPLIISLTRCLSGSPGDFGCLKEEFLIGRWIFFVMWSFFYRCYFLDSMQTLACCPHSIHHHCYLYHRRIYMSLLPSLCQCWPTVQCLLTEVRAAPFFPTFRWHPLCLYNSLVGAPCMDNRIQQSGRILDLRECFFNWRMLFDF